MKSSIFYSSLHKGLWSALLVSGLLFCFTFQSQAQCSTHRHSCCQKIFQTHLRIGASVHGIGGPATPRIGSTVGLVHELHILPWFQLRAEGNLIWQGRDENFWVADGDADYFSVNVPLMLQIMPSRGFYMASGFGLSYLAHAQGGEMPNNRSGLNWVGLLHYRFCCSRAGLELRWNHRFQNPNAPTSTDANGNIIDPFNDSSLQLALTVRF